MVVLHALRNFWNSPNCPTNFKLLVHDAVIRSKLVYGLDSIELTQSVLSRLNALQLKGIRRILQMKTIFVERRNTNELVFERADKIKNPRKIPGKDIKTYSEYIHFH